MEVKVKARVIHDYDMYDHSDRIVVNYTYKADGFKKHSSREILIGKRQETHDDYKKRLLRELQQMTKEDVVQIVKDSIIRNLMYRMACNSHDEELNRLLKELNSIKFTFTVKDKL